MTPGEAGPCGSPRPHALWEEPGSSAAARVPPPLLAMRLARPPAAPGRGSLFRRSADFWLGVPLVWLAGLLRRRREPPRVPERIALLKTAAIGDTVLMSGPLRDLRQAHPQARITLLCGPGNAAMAALLDGADEVLELPIGRVDQALRVLGKRRFDLVIDFGAWPRLDALYTLLARGAYRVGFATAGQHRHALYHRAVPHSATRHELDNYRALLAAAGVPSRSLPQLAAGASLPDACAQALRGRPYVVFHPWAGGSNAAAREWPLPRWLQLARGVLERGHCVVLTGAAGDWAANERLVTLAQRHVPFGSRLRQVINLAGVPLAQTAAVLAHAACTVSVNTGVMHLAAALGGPVVGLHGATNVARWGPIGPQAVAIVATGPGCGSLDLGFEPVPRKDCTDSISVEDVMEALQALIDATAAAARPTEALRSG